MAKQNIINKYKNNSNKNKGLSKEECLSLLEDLSGQSETDSDVELCLSDEDEFESFNVSNENIEINDNSKEANDFKIDGWCTNNKPPIINDFTGEYGIKVPIPDTPFDYIKLFITRELLEFLTIETNKYAEQERTRKINYYKNWKPVSVTELAKYLGLTIFFGVLKAPNIRQYWIYGKKTFVPAVSECMLFNRYREINSFFHCFDNNKIPKNNSDRLIKIRPLINYLLELFQIAYTPYKNLTIDEGFMAFKGRLNFKCYNPDKPAKYGIKLYILAEANSGYVTNFEIYSGIGSTTHDTVNHLMTNFKNCNYRLYMDNYYNSVKLSEQLLKDGIYTCGTLRLPRGVPKILQTELQSLKYNETKFIRKGDVFVISWKDKRVVSMISTLHNSITKPMKTIKKIKSKNNVSYKEIEINKPEAVLDYNKNMKGVDHFDQMVKYYSFARKTNKWTKKMAMYLLQMAVHNAFSLYKQYNTDKRPLKLLQFHEVLYEKLMDFNSEEWEFSGFLVEKNHLNNESIELIQNIENDMNFENNIIEENIVEESASKKRKILDPTSRLNKKLLHTLEINKDKKRFRCRVCKIQNKTKYQCEDCKIPLHPGSCYSIYHNFFNYSKKYISEKLYKQVTPEV